MMWEVEVEIEFEVERFLDFGRNDSFIGEFSFQRIEYRLLGLIEEVILCVDSWDSGSDLG